MTLKHYYFVDIHCSSDSREHLQCILFEFDCFGIEDKDDGFVAYFSEEDFSKEKIHDLFNSLQANHDFKFLIEVFEEKNWNAEWESGYKPMFVGDYCAIYAPFHEKKSGFKHQLTINPEMAFGTGHHETTQMMLEQMQTLNFEKQSVLDLGSGTGILATIAKKEGAKNVLAVDIDENAYKIMKENFVINGVGETQAQLGTIDDVKAQFDTILANINRNILLQASEAIAACLRTGGHLIISGFYLQDADLLKTAFEQLGLQEKTRIEKNSWCSIIFRK